MANGPILARIHMVQPDGALVRRSAREAERRLDASSLYRRRQMEAAVTRRLAKMAAFFYLEPDRKPRWKEVDL